MGHVGWRGKGQGTSHGQIGRGQVAVEREGGGVLVGSGLRRSYIIERMEMRGAMAFRLNSKGVLRYFSMEDGGEVGVPQYMLGLSV